MSNLSSLFPLGQEGRGVEDQGFDQKLTTPPSHYTEATLLNAMENAWRFAEDPALREKLKETEGIGTPATRASMIESLKKQKFIQTSKRFLLSTEKGQSLIDVAPRDLVDVGKTAVWETALTLIANGKMDPAIFMGKIRNQVMNMVETVKSENITIATGQKSNEIIEQRPCASIGCMDEGTLVFRVGKFGKYWSCNRAKDGCSNKIKCKDNKDPFLATEEDAPPQPIAGHGNPCPKCKKGKLATRVVKKETSPRFGQSFLACSERACDHMDFPASVGSESGGDYSVEPLAFHGQPCMTCGEGVFTTKKVLKKDSPSYGKRFLVCSINKSCQTLWEDQLYEGYDPYKPLVPNLSDPNRLPGEGKPCRVCTKPYVTQKVTSPKSKFFGKRFLLCSNLMCKDKIWEESAMKMF